ncbi:hypothetical protein NO559_16135 [Dasania sp. GY-MA-18]|uniref:Uncharacterized protein n=1 Tax=Dasania phycosphaerae TaxID=2950436 RepID=A0A9J6RS13_9GAMM|nr:MULTISPECIES: hypothetical protein [Dasania]MCR8924307.1 hypothetical protein [Dasania sp. GY-MA-18]MCZ0866960.1 hypothetical protein [Dasania phycosphaerae]MCZ0870464.1 hypothetical protein [Dasania phycosphaerae]
MKPSAPSVSNKANNVVQLADFQHKTQSPQRWVRLATETDHLSILYSNKYSHQHKYYSMKILCWALREDGSVTALVPWMNKVTACTELNDEYYGQWQGYYNPATEDLFDEPPAHKVLELTSAAQYFGGLDGNSNSITQEIPDNIGTHAMLNSRCRSHLVLTDVLSWRLYGDGRLEAMIIDEELVDETPILTGARCLYPASKNPEFRYFFQHHIANQIKAEDPDALAAIALLLDQ